jgi:hypothetical protein
LVGRKNNAPSSFFSSSFFSSAAAPPAAAPPAAAPPAAAAPPDGTEASLAEPSAISCVVTLVSISYLDPGPTRVSSYLVDVLAIELRQELLEALLISLNADGAEDGLDVISRRAGVATKAQEEVSGEVLHFDGLLAVGGVLVSTTCCEGSTNRPDAQARSK